MIDAPSTRQTATSGPALHASQHLSQFSGNARERQTEAVQREALRQQPAVRAATNSEAQHSGGTGGVSTWTLMLRIWPLEDRPEEMLVPEVVNGLTFDQLMKYKKHYEALVKKEGKGEGVFGKDSSIPAVSFDAGEDNCADMFHPAR